VAALTDEDDAAPAADAAALGSGRPGLPDLTGGLRDLLELDDLDD
jgi:hypothetical protein